MAHVARNDVDESTSKCISGTAHPRTYYLCMQGKGNGIAASEGINAKYGSNALTRLLRRLNPFARTTIATFPCTTVINAATIQQDQLLGPTLQRQLEEGRVPPEDAVKLWLVVHRAMGPHSPYHAYVQTLPARVDAPMQYTDAQLNELRGTSLFHAVQACARPSLLLVGCRVETHVVT